MRKSNIITDEFNLEDLINPCEELRQSREQRKWSERLQEKNMEKVLKMACANTKKRPIEGLHKSEMRGLIQEGVKLLMACAQKMAKRPRQAGPVLCLPSSSQGEGDADEA
ncbi:unnamed protein product [Urochloa humidicola]